MLGFFWTAAPSQGQDEPGQVDRQPAVAGQFYPSDPQQLRSDLADLFARAADRQGGDVLALISPHAGYVFSGEVAASSFNQLDPAKKYENIFILASSHRVSFDGASIYTRGNYRTPLGKVKVNIGLAKKLVSEYGIFTGNPDAHIYEHSLEVQLPFLQYRLGEDIQIVPIILGTQRASTCTAIAMALAPYFNERNLFIVSTDFSHYPDYDDAYMVDKITANAILSNSPQKLQETLESNEDLGIDNLATSLCGWTSVLTLLDMTATHPDLEFLDVRYMNSGDAKIYGDKDRVVGYHAISVVRKSSQSKPGRFSLSEQEKEALLGIARSAISHSLRNEKIPDAEKASLTDPLRQSCGAFVTLHKDGRLRGCIGRFDADDPLYKVVEDMAISAATRDYRFPPVKAEELDDLLIEISVLSPLKPIQSIKEIELGKHGIYMKKGINSGTFLPQVAAETGWSLEEFLGHCAQDKARIGWEGWKDAELFVYEALIFSEEESH